MRALIETSGEGVYDQKMRRSRTLLALVLSMVVVVQPWASPPCDCDSHTGDAGMHVSGSGDHEHGAHHAGKMPAHDSSMHDSSETNDCELTGTVCKCGTCTHFVGLIFESMDAVLLTAAQDPSSLPHYVEPATEQAFRPPIHI